MSKEARVSKSRWPTLDKRTPPSIVLTGAGYSRNWGGWLANETFEYLLGCSLNERIKNLLWQCYEERTGFEGALAWLQSKGKTGSDVEELTRALRGMFDVMNGGFQKAQGPEIGGGHPAAKLLGHFDAIFTLNQDTLMEQRYTPTNSQRWNSMRLPGTKLFDPRKGELYDLRIPDNPANFKLASNFQPYFKLHGSSSFRHSAEADDALLIMGGDKLESIDGSVLLKWYRSEFQRFLAIPDTRLVVIGYSFGDQHINELIRHAAIARTGLSIFIVDPSGVDVLYNRPASNSCVPPNHSSDKLLEVLTPALFGASRRSLESLFRHQQPDEIERSKLDRFLGL